MDSASMAAQSDPEHNYQFRRPWTQIPKRRNPGRDTGVSFGISTLNSDQADTTADLAAARAVSKARRRAAELDMRAALLAAVGLRDAGLRDYALADRIRAEVLV